MDPLSITAAVVGISSFALQLITQLSSFVDDVQNTATEVQALTNELASFYASIGHIKLAITATRTTPIPDAFNRDVGRIIRTNEATLNELKRVIDEAETADTDRSATRVWKTVKFTFKTKQVNALRRRIQAENEVLGKMILLLNDARGDRIERRLEMLDDIHSNVESLVRQNVKEVLVVLENEDETDPSQRGEFVLKDRTSRNKPQPVGSDSATSSQPSAARSDSPTTEDVFLNWTNSSAGQAAFANAAGQLAEHFRRQKFGIGSGFSFEEQTTRAAFDLTADERRALEVAKSKTWLVNSATAWLVDNSEVLASIKREPSEEGRRMLRVQIIPERVLSYQIQNEKGEVPKVVRGENIRGRFFSFNGRLIFNKTTIAGATVTIEPRDDFENVKEIVENFLGAGNVYRASFDFNSAADAMEMYTSLIQLQDLWMKAWELHTIAFSRIDGTLHVGNSEELLKATITEILSSRQ